MLRRLHIRSLPGVLFGIMVLLLALGNCWLGVYPYGTAVWIRPLLSNLLQLVPVRGGNRFEYRSRQRLLQHHLAASPITLGQRRGWQRVCIKPVFSLTPCFSWVWSGHGKLKNRFNGFSGLHAYALRGWKIAMLGILHFHDICHDGP